MNDYEHYTPLVQALINHAEAIGNHTIKDMLMDSRAGFSIEELKAELGSDFSEQGWDVVILRHADHCPA